MKQMHGGRVYVQSVGVRPDREVDSFMVEVAREIGVDLSRHRPKSFDDMEAWGDDIGAYDLIVALTPASQLRALEYTRHSSVEVLYWPTLDPSGIGERRGERLDAYRQTRDQIHAAILETFGRGTEEAVADA